MAYLPKKKKRVSWLYADFVFLVQIAGKINRTIRDLGLRELGQLEQDLVFGDAGMKDVIKYLTTKDVRNCWNTLG